MDEAMIDPAELIPSDQAAPLLHVKPETLPQWRLLGRGPKFYRIGRYCFYRREDIAAWIAAQVRDPANKTRVA